MPTLSSALAMDGDNYLHPEGPQLDVSLFPAASPNNMEVWFGFTHVFRVGGGAKQSSTLQSNGSCISVYPGLSQGGQGAVLRCIIYLYFWYLMEVCFLSLREFCT